VHHPEGRPPAAAAKDETRYEARVTRVDRGAVSLHGPSGETRAMLAGPLRSARGQDAPAVGDLAEVRVLGDGTHVLDRLCPRTTAFVRRASGEATHAQVVAANVDLVLVVDTMPEPGLRRIERYLALAWESGASPAIVLTKADLAGDPADALADVDAIAFGVPVLLTSALGGDGIEELRELVSGRLVALLGPSGSGKSTLVNALAQSEVMETGEVRDSDGKGRHTTTHRELVPLPGGGALIDTPGMRTLGMWDAAEGLALTFSDVEAVAAECRFADCSHEGEPGCAVRAALEAGELDAARYASWRRLQREERANAIRADARLASDERRRNRVQNRSLRERKRIEGR